MQRKPERSVAVVVVVKGKKWGEGESNLGTEKSRGRKGDRGHLIDLKRCTSIRVERDVYLLFFVIGTSNNARVVYIQS